MFHALGGGKGQVDLIFASLDAGNNQICGSSERCTVFGDNPRGILDVLLRAERVSVVFDAVCDKRFQIDIGFFTDRAARHIGVDLHPHRVDGNIAGEHHRLARGEIRHGGVFGR